MTALKLTLIAVGFVVAAVLGTYERQLRMRGRQLGPRATRFAMVFAVVATALAVWMYNSPP